MPPRWSCACAPARAVDRDGAEYCRPFDPIPHAPDWPAPPRSDHSPMTDSPRPCENQFLNFSVDPWPARGSPFLRAIELAGDEPSVPCQDGVRQGGSRHLAECLATQSTANLAKLRSLCVRELQPPLQLAPQDPVFSSQILVPQQQLLVHRHRNVGQDTCPLHKSPLCARRSARAPLIAPKNLEDDTRRGYAGMG